MLRRVFTRFIAASTVAVVALSLLSCTTMVSRQPGPDGKHPLQGLGAEPPSYLLRGSFLKDRFQPEWEVSEALLVQDYFKSLQYAPIRPAKQYYYGSAWGELFLDSDRKPLVLLVWPNFTLPDGAYLATVKYRNGKYYIHNRWDALPNGQYLLNTSDSNLWSRIQASKHKVKS